MRIRPLIAGPFAALATLLAVAPAALAQTAGDPAVSAARAPSITAPSAIVIDARTGERLYARHPDDSRAIASTTKLMTAWITLARTKPRDVFAMPPYPISPAESQLGLRTGERMTVHDLLRAMMLPSANDAAYDLAVNIGGSKAGFVRLMNQRARALHLTETHYSTPVGLDDPGNYSSARDLADLAMMLLRNKTFAGVVNMGSARLRSGSHPRTVLNRNDLVRRYTFVSGVKTGHTARAGYVLVGSASAHGAKVVSAVLGTSSEATRDADSIALLRWGVAQFRRSIPVRANKRYARAAVRYHDNEKVDLVAAHTVRMTIRRGMRVTRRVNAPDEVEGPLAKGSRVGTISVVYRGRVVRTVPLVTASSIEGSSFLQKAASKLGGPLPTLALLALLGATALLALRVRATRGMRRERAGS